MGFNDPGQTIAGNFISVSFLCPEEQPCAAPLPAPFPESQTLRAGSTEIRGLRKLCSPRTVPSTGAGDVCFGFFSENISSK